MADMSMDHIGQNSTTGTDHSVLALEDSVPLFSYFLCNMTQLVTNDTEQCMVPNLSEAGKDLLVIIMTIASATFGTGMILNTFLILLIACSRELRNEINFMIANLCTANILLLSVMGGYMIYIRSDNSKHYSQEFHQYFFPSLDSFTYTISVLLLLAVTMKTTAPLFSSNSKVGIWVISTKRVVAMAWLYSAGMLILSLFSMIPGAAKQFIYVMDVYKTFSVCVVGSSVLLFCYCFTIWKIIRNLVIASLPNHTSSLLPATTQVSPRNGQHLTIVVVKLLSLAPAHIGWSFYYAHTAHEVAWETIQSNDLINFMLMVGPWFIASATPLFLMLASRSLLWHSVNYARCFFVCLSKKIANRTSRRESSCNNDIAEMFV